MSRSLIPIVWSYIDVNESKLSHVRETTHCAADIVEQHNRQEERVEGQRNCCQLIHHGCISIKAIFVDFRKFFFLFAEARESSLLPSPPIISISLSLSHTTKKKRLNIVSFLRHNNTEQYYFTFHVVVARSEIKKSTLMCLFRVCDSGYSGIGDHDSATMCATI